MMTFLLQLMLTVSWSGHSEPPHATTLVGMYLPELKNAPRFATSWYPIVQTTHASCLQEQYGEFEHQHYLLGAVR